MYVVKNVDVNLVTLPLWFLLGVKVWNDKMDFNPIAGTCVFNAFSYFRLWHLLRSVEIKKKILSFSIIEILSEGSGQFRIPRHFLTIYQGT